MAWHSDQRQYLASAGSRIGCAKEKGGPEGPPKNRPENRGLLENAHIICVADEAHLLDVRLLSDGKHFVHQFVARGGFWLQVKLRDRVHLLRRIQISPKLRLGHRRAVPQDLAAMGHVYDILDR